MVLRPGQRVVHLPGIGVSASRRAVSVAAASWWLAGGAPAPVAAYQPKGAASLATSYVNLVNPGTYDAAPGTAPTHDTATGWTFVSGQYLTTGIVVGTARDWAMLVRFSNVTLVANSVFAGAIMIASGYPRFTLGLEGAGSPRLYGNGGYLGTGTQAAAAVMAMAATKGYWNGSQESGSISSVSGDISIGIDIGRRRRSDNKHDMHFAGSIQAVAVWSISTNHATWMPAVMAACALI